MVAAQPLGVGRQKLDDPLDNIRHIAENWDNRFSLDRSILEQYTDGRFAIALYCDLCSGTHDIEDATGADREGAVDDLVIVLVYCVDTSQRGYREIGNQQPVFVDHVKSVEGPQGIIPSLVRLYVIEDKRTDFGTGLSYLSVFDGRFKSVPVLKNGELRLFPSRPFSFPQNLCDGQVERASKIVDGIADYQRKLSGGIFSKSELENILSGFRILIDAQNIRLRIEESQQADIKVVDMLLGPFEL